jgi:hypothetical protein
MKLPNGGKAIVDERKIRQYLVSLSHPVGRFKAKFFASLGFGPDNWRELAAAILQVATTDDAQLVEDNEHGRKYLVSGTLTGPQARSAEVVSVWIVRVGDDVPRLVTVYPR